MSSPTETSKVKNADYASFKRRQFIFRLVSFCVLAGVFWIAIRSGIIPAAIACAITCVCLWFVGAWVGSFDPTLRKDDLPLILSAQEDEPLSKELTALKTHAQAKGKYPFEAYLAVICACKFNPISNQFESKIVNLSGTELTKRFVASMKHQYPNHPGQMLKEWHILRPDDIGEIVFDMVRVDSN